MPVWLLALLPKAFDLVISLFGGGKKDADTSRQLGQAETRAAASSAALARTEEDRRSKERTDAQIRTTPDDDLIKRL